jgi:hypothetical protein
MGSPFSARLARGNSAGLVCGAAKYHSGQAGSARSEQKAGNWRVQARSPLITNTGQRLFCDPDKHAVGLID